jgi:hypothetical protein
VLVLLVCFTIDTELLTLATSDCVVDGVDPFRGAWMHMVARPEVQCTAQDGQTKTQPPQVGSVLQCLVITSAHGDLCVGGEDLAGRQFNARALLSISLLLFLVGCLAGLVEVHESASDNRREDIVMDPVDA